MKNSKKIGTITEQIVIAELCKLNFIILKPLGDFSPYDIVLYFKNKFIKCQIKTIKNRKNVLICRFLKNRINTKRYFMKKYKMNEVDYFLFYSYNTNKVYVVKHDKVNRSAYNLRLKQCLNYQEKLVHYAHFYELNKKSFN